MNLRPLSVHTQSRDGPFPSTNLRINYVYKELLGVYLEDYSNGTGVRGYSGPGSRDVQVGGVGVD